MAHFRSTIKGNRGQASRLGTKNGGMEVTCNGWNMGVRVYAFHENDKDTFRIYKTGGSNAKTNPELIAEVG